MMRHQVTATLLGSMGLLVATLTPAPALAQDELRPWSESSFAFSRPLSEPGWYTARAESLLGSWTCLECSGQRVAVLPVLALSFVASMAFEDGTSVAGFSMEVVRSSHPGSGSSVLARGFVTVDRQAWSGLRFALLANWSEARFTGVQWSTGLNFAHEVEGMQLGLVNVAGSVTGVQIGLVNVSSSADTVQIGLVNVRPRG